MPTWGRRRGASAEVRAAAAGCAVGAVLGALFLWASYPLIDPAGAPWERAFLLALHGTVGLAGRTAAYEISQFGYPLQIAAVAAACLLVWCLRGMAWKAAFLLAATAALTLLDYGGKPVFARARPDLFPHPFVAGAAYPSGHALFAVGYYGVIAYLALAGAGRGLRVAGWTLWAAFAAALGLSRLVLGVHWPTDVLGGYGAGAIVLVVTTSAARRWRRTPGGMRGRV